MDLADESAYDPIFALEDCFLPWEVFERVFELADEESLRTFAPTCKFFAAETSKDSCWHRIFNATTFYIVPVSVTSWKERFRFAFAYNIAADVPVSYLLSKMTFRHRKPSDNLGNAVKAAMSSAPGAVSAAEPMRIIVPPGKHHIEGIYKDINAYQSLFMEGYVPAESSEQREDAKEPAGQPADESKPIINARIYVHGGGELKNLTLLDGSITIYNGVFSMESCHLQKTPYGVFLHCGVTSSKFKNCKFDNVGYWCIVPDKCGPMEVDNCEFINFAARGISVQCSSEVVIRRCRFLRGTKEAQAIVSRSAAKTTLEDCLFEDPNASFAVVSAMPLPNASPDFSGYLKVKNCVFRNFKLTGVYIKDVFAIIESCEFVDGFAAIQIAQCENLTECVQVKGNTITHCRNGIVAHSRGMVHISGNRIVNNTGKGILVTADSKREIKDDNVVRDNAEGDIHLQPFDENVFLKGYPEDVVHPLVQDAINAGKCTFTVTQNNYFNQLVFRCRTCGLVDSEGMCSVCKDKCHAGHDVFPEAKVASFFCDCGALLKCKACK